MRLELAMSIENSFIDIEDVYLMMGCDERAIEVLLMPCRLNLNIVEGIDYKIINKKTYITKELFEKLKVGAKRFWLQAI